MPDDAITEARSYVQTVWDRFVNDRNLNATLADWSTSAVGDGSPLLSVQATGPGAGHALDRFISTGQIGLPTPGDTRPAADYGTPGRTAYVWRSHGVWIELWHPDNLPAAANPAPQPVAAPAEIAAPGTSGRDNRGGLSGPSGRLTFTRRSKKETSRA